jgi:hypothetical protein
VGLVVAFITGGTLAGGIVAFLMLLARPAPPANHDPVGKEAIAGPPPGVAEGKKEELASTGWATVKGRVTLEGDRPDIAAMNRELLRAINQSQDAKNCLSGPPEQKEEPEWRIGQNNGVENVFVWLKPPRGRFFKIDWEKELWPSEVVIDQPHCAFVPHAAVLFPGAYNPDKPGELKPSGQKFIVKNSAPMNHNTKWSGGDINPGDNRTLASGGKIEAELKPDDTQIVLQCNIHPWMRGYIRVFDHPYATVTDKDGNYKIEHVPAGAELRIVVWYESGAFGNKGKDGDRVTLEADKDNVKDYTIKLK